MRYKFLLFDHDGVLVDTEYWYYQATRRALAELGVELDLRTYQQIMVRGAASWELAQQAGIADARIAAMKVQRNHWYQTYLQNEPIAIAGVDDVLAELSRKSCRMAIVTTSKGVDFELIHRDRTLVSHMEFVLTREDYTNAKPDPEPYLQALQRFGASPEEALVIEDSERGLRSAVAAGIDCAIVHNSFTAGHDFSSATFRLQNIAQLPGLLASVE